MTSGHPPTAQAGEGPLPSAQGLTGLTQEEVLERRRRGQDNDVSESTTHSVGQILRSNILTPFNALLGGLLAVILVVGPLQDALFGLILVANTLTGVIQELRAKRTLDHLTVLSAPKARVVREGTDEEVGVADIVLDDVLKVASGDQMVVDGEVLDEQGLEMNESLITGESEAVAKAVGDEVLSGSFVAVGNGLILASRVGHEAYARKLAEEARKFTRVHSELRTGLDRMVRLVAWAMLPTAGLLLFSQLSASVGVKAALRSTVAGVVSMVPEGLVLLMSVAFAVGVVRLAQRNTLVQELPAVETLARVDVICLDKTGTLTTGDIRVESVDHLVEGKGAEPALGALARADPNPNATLAAIKDAFAGEEGWRTDAVIPFSSTRKWSGASFEGNGTWVLGAPEMLLVPGGDEVTHDSFRRAVDRHAKTGRRVVMLAYSPEALTDDERLPPRIKPQALVILGDQIRPDAAETIRYFGDQDVAVKIISGDHPGTVAAVAARAGVSEAEKSLDARTLPEQPHALSRALEEHVVFGRVTPHQKRAMVAALKQQGHVVAMTGDGVNDVLALKDADIGIAMGSGSSASRGAAQLVLLDNTFSSLPAAVAEGRRVINNIERVGNLFLTKTVYSMILAIVIALAKLPFPFLPRHLTLVGSLTIGIPAFFLALVPSVERARTGFVNRILRFAVPTGLLAAMATFSGYYVSLLRADVSREESRATATIILLLLGLLVFADISAPLTKWRRPLLGAMIAIFLAALLIPGVSELFSLEPPPPMMGLVIAGIVSITYPLMHLARRSAEHWKRPSRRRSVTLQDP